MAWRTVKWTFIVLCVYLATLFFRDEKVPGAWVEAVLDRYLPAGVTLHLDSLSFGFRRGVHVQNLKIYDSGGSKPLTPVVSASAVDYYPLLRRLRVEDFMYPRLPDSYYADECTERNADVEGRFPALGFLAVTMVRSNILSVRAERLTFDVEVSPRRIDVSNLRLFWPDRDRRMEVDGFCSLDLDRQEVYGEVDGLARQEHIRPMLVAIDVPSALPYMDGFTEVPEPCEAWCAWRIGLRRMDFDLWLDLHPILGKYNAVSMRKADGKIHLRNCVQNGHLNYETKVGPISGVDVEGRKLNGSVLVTGTNGYNTVTVDATSTQPLADVLKIGGFTGDYVGQDVVGDSVCRLQFRFPRSMTNNYEVLDGYGHIAVTNGTLMRMKGFRGLVEAMPSIAPAVTWFSDSTQASCDYVIENGVVKTDNVYIEGTMFSIKMYGQFDAVQNKLDFTARVQFAKKDSIAGKLLHPLAWPFTKLLLEFRLTGSADEPKWTYISVIDRVIEAVL